MTKHDDLYKLLTLKENNIPKNNQYNKDILGTGNEKEPLV
jgi:hypothetical protein